MTPRIRARASSRVVQNSSLFVNYIYRNLMQKQISVVLDKGVEFAFHVPEGVPLAHDVARAWLDKQFIELECEPLRASGKVLTADKVLVVTQAAGTALFNDAQWVAGYVAAVSAALGKPMIRVDVPSMAITY